MKRRTNTWSILLTLLAPNTLWTLTNFWGSSAGKYGEKTQSWAHRRRRSLQAAHGDAAPCFRLLSFILFLATCPSYGNETVKCLVEEWWMNLWRFIEWEKWIKLNIIKELRQKKRKGQHIWEWDPKIWKTY